VGKELARRFGMDYYDKELLDIAARESGFCTEVFERSDEHKGFFQSLFESVVPVIGHTTGFYQNQLSDESLFRIQAEAIRKAAAKLKGGVFIGRCADYVLRDYPNCLNVFISANEEDRVKRMMQRFAVDEKEAARLLRNGDSNREAYYNFYASSRWGEAKTYDLCINSSFLGIEKTIDFIEDFASKMKCKE
jgi:cytidylate kinase